MSAFVGLVALLHVFRPGLTPGQHRVSEYANGPGGFVMTLAFLFWSASFLSAASATLQARGLPSRARFGVGALLLVAAAGAAVSAACPTGTSAGKVPPGHVLSSANHAHDIASGALALALWGAAMLSLTVHGGGRWRWGMASLLVVAGAVSVLLSSVGLGLGGVRQRALILVGCGWLLMWLAALRRADGIGAPAP